MPSRASRRVVFRPSFIFGPGGGAISQFARVVRYLPLTPVVGAGEQQLQPICVEDVAKFFARAVSLPEAANQTFEIGGPERITWNELWERLAAALGKRRARVHLPVSLVRRAGGRARATPQGALTRDQLTMLEAGDNVCDSPGRRPSRSASS